MSKRLVAVPLGLLALSGLAGAFTVDLESLDCQPTRCELDEGALRLCADGGARRVLDRTLFTPHYRTVLTWSHEPGAISSGGRFSVVFRDGEAEDHRVTFYTMAGDGGGVALEGGLPPVRADVDLSVPGEYVLDVTHGFRLLVVVTDPLGRRSEPINVLLPEGHDAVGAVAYEAADGGCFAIHALNGVSYRWDCGWGSCTLDRDGLVLCSDGRVRLEEPLSDGTVSFRWLVTAWSEKLLVRLRDDQSYLARHTVTLDARNGEVSFSDGLVGASRSFAFDYRTYDVRIVHGKVGLVGKTDVYVDQAGTLGAPFATAQHAVAESATMLGFAARNAEKFSWTASGCQRLAGVLSTP